MISLYVNHFHTHSDDTDAITERDNSLSSDMFLQVMVYTSRLYHRSLNLNWTTYRNITI